MRQVLADATVAIATQPGDQTEEVVLQLRDDPSGPGEPASEATRAAMQDAFAALGYGVTVEHVTFGYVRVTFFDHADVDFACEAGYPCVVRGGGVFVFELCE